MLNFGHMLEEGEEGARVLDILEHLEEGPPEDFSDQFNRACFLLKNHKSTFLTSELPAILERILYFAHRGSTANILYQGLSAIIHNAYNYFTPLLAQALVPSVLEIYREEEKIKGQHLIHLMMGECLSSEPGENKDYRVGQEWPPFVEALLEQTQAVPDASSYVAYRVFADEYKGWSLHLLQKLWKVFWDRPVEKGGARWAVISGYINMVQDEKSVWAAVLAFMDLEAITGRERAYTFFSDEKVAPLLQTHLDYLVYRLGGLDGSKDIGRGLTQALAEVLEPAAQLKLFEDEHLSLFYKAELLEWSPVLSTRLTWPAIERVIAFAYHNKEEELKVLRTLAEDVGSLGPGVAEALFHYVAHMPLKDGYADFVEEVAELLQALAARVDLESIKLADIVLLAQQARIYGYPSTVYICNNILPPVYQSALTMADIRKYLTS